MSASWNETHEGKRHNSEGKDPWARTQGRFIFEVTLAASRGTLRADASPVTIRISSPRIPKTGSAPAKPRPRSPRAADGQKWIATCASVDLRVGRCSGRRRPSRTEAAGPTSARPLSRFTDVPRHSSRVASTTALPATPGPAAGPCARGSRRTATSARVSARRRLVHRLATTELRTGHLEGALQAEQTLAAGHLAQPGLAG